MSCVSFGCPVYAGDTGLNGYNASFYRRFIDGSGGFNVPNSSTLGRWFYHLGLDFDYARRPLTIVNPARAGETDILENQLMLNVGAAVGLTDWLTAGLTLPAALYQSGQGCIDTTCSQVSPYSGEAFGNLMLGLKLAAMRQPRLPLGFAMFGLLELPTGSRKGFLGDGKVGGEIGLALDRRFKRWALGIASSYRFIGKTQVLSSTYDDYMTMGGWFDVGLIRGLRFITEAKASLMIRQMNTKTNEAEFLAGLSYKFGKKDEPKGFSAHFLGGRRITNAFGAPDMRLASGVGWTGRFKKEATITEAGPILGLEHVVYFRFNQSDMTHETRDKLRDYVDSLKETPPDRVSVEGHSDLWGRERYNDELSERRAETVREYMIEEGVPRSVIEVHHFGSSRPAEKEMTLKGQGKNRRVEIYVSH